MDEGAGEKAIQIEDQEMPKKCGYTPGRRVVSLKDALRLLDRHLPHRRPEVRLRGAGAGVPVPGAARQNGGLAVPAYSMDELNKLVGFPEVWAFEKRSVEASRS